VDSIQNNCEVIVNYLDKKSCTVFQGLPLSPSTNDINRLSVIKKSCVRGLLQMPFTWRWRQNERWICYTLFIQPLGSVQRNFCSDGIQLMSKILRSLLPMLL